mgnify:CR=1 FL=1
MARPFALASAIAGLLCWGSGARAQPVADDALRLTWRAPAGCPSQEDVRGATLRTVESDARGAKTAPLEASADVTACRSHPLTPG